MQNFVYIIGKEKDLCEPYNYCYVGVTSRLECRWKEHSKSKFTVGKYIRENNLTYENNMKIIFSGEDVECFELEEKLRPFQFMGLNEAVGGCGGYTYYDKSIEAKEKRSKKMKEIRKNADKSWGENISKAKKKNGALTGKTNPKAKKWKLISPNKEEYFIHGKLQQFCNDHNLLFNTLRKYRNSIVPSVIIDGYGGFRYISDEQNEKRHNTVGWSLIEL